MTLIVAVEGSTDVPVVHKVVTLAGWAPAFEPIVTSGMDSLDWDLRGYNAAAKGSPWFVLLTV